MKVKERLSVESHADSPQTDTHGKTSVPMNRRPRVLLADDHTMLLDAFRRLLEPQCEIVGTAGDGRALVDLAVNIRPEVIVLDISMPRLNGMDACAQLRRKMPRMRFVFLTVNEDPEIAAEAIGLGASGYLLKNSASGELFTAIEQALAGKIYVTPLITKGVPLDVFLHKATEPGVKKLSVRQREVLQLLAEGLLMKEIAELLRVSERTVAFHKYTIMDQLGVKTGAELVQYALEHGMLKKHA
jgi:DNA-binding NarL/FixJ family response regulator